MTFDSRPTTPGEMKAWKQAVQKNEAEAKLQRDHLLEQLWLAFGHVFRCPCGAWHNRLTKTFNRGRVKYQPRRMIRFKKWIREKINRFLGRKT